VRNEIPEDWDIDDVVSIAQDVCNSQMPSDLAALYNMCKGKNGLTSHPPIGKPDTHGEEECRVTEVIESLKRVQIPSHQLDKLGMDVKWAERVSPDFVRSVISMADKHKALLKELSKK